MLNTTSLLRRRILAAANRMMSTHRVSFSFDSPRSPWLVLEPRCSKESNGAIFNFWCCAERRKYLSDDAKKNSPDGGEYIIDYSDSLEMQLLGSSPGWLAFQYRDDVTNFLLDPVSYDAVYLPPWIDNHHMEVETLVFSDSERKAFVISGSGDSLAFCSTSTRRLHDGWTPFAGGEYYESMAYSTAYRRLFCITSALKLEAWDVGHDSPRIDWVAHLDGPDPPSPDPLDMKYLACEEQSGQLFLVVRHVSKAEAKLGKDLTIDFKVYRIEDQRQRRLILMRDSLEGMAFFVGSNQAIAIREAIAIGVRPDSVYFTFDRRLSPYNRFVGNFDYRRRFISRVFCPVGGSPYPVWFTPHPRHTILLP